MEKATVSLKETLSLPLYLITYNNFVLVQNLFMDNYSNSQFALYMKEGPIWLFRMLNKYMRNALPASCSRCEVYRQT